MPARRSCRRRGSRRAFAVVRWPLVLAGLGVVAGLGWWFLRPLPYAVESFIEIRADRATPWNEWQPRDEHTLRRQRELYVALLRSPQVIELAVQRQDIKILDVVKDGQAEVKWLQEHLEVNVYRELILGVRLRAANAYQAQQFAMLLDAVVQSFTDNALMQNKVARAARLDALRVVIHAIRKGLEQQLIALHEREASVAEPSMEQKIEFDILRRSARAQEDVLVEYTKKLVREQAWLDYDQTSPDEPGAPVRVIQRALVTEEPTP